MLLNSNPFLPLAWVVVLHLAAWSAGRRMHAGLARWEERDVSRADSVFHAQLLGFWLLAHVCLLLAFAHQLYARLLAGIVLALAAESVVHLIRSRRGPRPILGWQIYPHSVRSSSGCSSFRKRSIRYSARTTTSTISSCPRPIWSITASSR